MNQRKVIRQKKKRLVLLWDTLQNQIEIVLLQNLSEKEHEGMCSMMLEFETLLDDLK